VDLPRYGTTSPSGTQKRPARRLILMEPMLPLLGIKMEAVAIVGKSLGQDTCCDVEQFELAKKGKLYIYIY